MCLNILPAHALTGCDQVPVHQGIGKLIMLKTLKERKHLLGVIGDLNADFDQVLSEATKFIIIANPISSHRVSTKVAV